MSLPEPGPDEVLVRTLHTGVSRGTETLVFRGEVPRSQHSAMRAPFQEGEFPGPVKYGYLNVGVVEHGPAELLGRSVFCLFPHQTDYVVPTTAVTPLPDDVPSARAVLAGTVETAVNALWDAAPLVGDRVTVVGAGMVGCVRGPARPLPRRRRELVDVDAGRGRTGWACRSPPPPPPGGRDLVLHASAASAGLQLVARAARPGGHSGGAELVRRRRGRLALGGVFHSGRLSIRASQVGTSRRRGGTALVRGPARAGASAAGGSGVRRPSHGRVTTSTSFPGPRRLSAGSLAALCHTITYERA